MLRRIFGPKMDEETRDWKKLNNEELHNLYPSPNMIKSRRLRLVEHVARKVDEKSIHNFGRKI
jgi:hypothetical protein